MNFKNATDRLFSRIDHRDLAKALGVSVASIRQARLRPDALAHRSPHQIGKTLWYALLRSECGTSEN